MKAGKTKRLRAAGWKTGSTKDFLRLGDQEATLVEARPCLMDALRQARRKRGISQGELAKRMGSSQSRVAKIPFPSSPCHGGIVAGMTAELDVLQDAAARLERAGIAYMLTGSIALSYYAQPRMTRDIDLVAELSGRDAKSVAGLFAPDYYVSDADIATAMAGEGMFNVLHLARLVKLDFIVRKDSPYRRHEFSRRQRVRLPGFDTWIVSREDLILSKLAWAKDSGSELQLRDVRALLAGNFDRTYLERWAEELSVSELLRSSLDAGHDS